MKIIPNFLAVLMAGLFLASCGDSSEPVEERIRAIKPYYVSEPAGGDVRRFSGTIVAADTSLLSFSVPGTVTAVNVTPGDRVQKGQELATLDSELYELDVAAAKSELQAAQANFTNADQNLERQKELFQKGWASKAAYDQAVASLATAEANLNVARSRLSSAQRNLNNTRLLAPFDGIIASQEVEAFSEVTAGQTLFLINSEGLMEIELSIPDAIVNRLAVGLPITVNATTLPSCGCNARVTEIGSIAGAANSVLVKASLFDPPSDLIPGMAAEATLILTQTDGTRGFLVPLVAIVAGDDENKGYVFKYDPETGTVSKTPVEGREGRDNLVEITSGVEAGDILASAGVSFLRDGQKVKIAGQQ